MRALSICLMLVGVVWALLVILAFLTMAGIAEPVSFLVTGGLFAGLLIGPFLLIAGAILVLRGKHAKPGAVLVLIGCAVLTILIGGPEISEPFRTRLPLEAPPSYALDAVIVILILLSDLGAFRLYRLVFAAGTSAAAR